MTAIATEQVVAIKTPAWQQLKAAVTAIRPLQVKDGSIPDLSHHDAARGYIHDLCTAITELVPYFPHDDRYLHTVIADLQKWVTNDFTVPDFLDSLLALTEINRREDGLQHLIVFAMYTQNGNPSRNLEALILHIVWPDWIAHIEATTFENPLFLPVAFDDFTSGYDTNAAVLFPETVSTRETPPMKWGAIFCDRESARFRSVVGAAVDSLKVALPEDAQQLLADPKLAQETFVLWDLIHDRAHMRGDLPFDPFLVKQRLPYWLYSLEELRCDLTAFRGATELEKAGIKGAALVKYASILDRSLRFPLTGERQRNYDSVGGQILFAALRKGGAFTWHNSTLAIDWDKVSDVAHDLLARIEELYWHSIDRNKLSHWQTTYELVREFVEPHPASCWSDGIKAMPINYVNKDYLDAILQDEFPLSMFFEMLLKRLKPVVEATKGIRT
jgi:hypothetical protein